MGRHIGTKPKERWYLYVDGRRVTTLFRKREIGEVVNTTHVEYNAKIYDIKGKCLMATTNF